MTTHKTSTATLEGCLCCGGIFVDRDSRARVVAARSVDAAQASDLAAAHARYQPDVRKRIACPVCGKPMTTTQVAGAVDLDVCDEHGAWFDRDELRRFIDALETQRSSGASPKRSKQKSLASSAAIGGVAVGAAATTAVVAASTAQESGITAGDAAEVGFSLLELVGDLLGALAD